MQPGQEITLSITGKQEGAGADGPIARHHVHIIFEEPSDDYAHTEIDTTTNSENLQSGISLLRFTVSAYFSLTVYLS